MKKKALVLTCFVALLMMFANKGICFHIYNIHSSPATPASLQFNEHIDLTFDYYTAVFGDWGWKLASSIEDAHNFLNGLGGYTHPVKDAGITAVWTGSQTSFYIFYKSGTEGQIFGDWGWKLATSVEDAHNFINGLGTYSQPVKYARISAVRTGTQNLFYIFYKSGDPDDIRVFVRPYTNGSLTPNYAAHSSPAYPAGNGSGTGWFTITSGEVTVDSLRFHVTNADQSVLLHEFFIPVEYHFSSGTDTDSSPANLNRPTKYYLHQNYPNPFNPKTKINFDLPEACYVELKIYNHHGQEIFTLVNSQFNAGYHSIVWNGTNNNGRSVSSGIYFYQIKAGEFVESRKMSLLR